MVKREWKETKDIKGHQVYNQFILEGVYNSSKRVIDNYSTEIKYNIIDFSAFKKYLFHLTKVTTDRKERLAYLEQKHLKVRKERLENGSENPLLKAFYNIHDLLAIIVAMDFHLYIIFIKGTRGWPTGRCRSTRRSWRKRESS